MPASATGGVALLVSTTSSKVEHIPLVTVHLNVILKPAFNPVTVLVVEVLSVMLAPFAGPTTVHNPVAVTGKGAVAFKVKLAELHNS